MSERFFRTVSEPAKIVARAMNRAGGGSEATPSQIPIMDNSPESIDHLFEFFTGGAGRFVTNTTELGRMLAAGEPIEVERVPFVRRLVGKTTSYQIRDAYYAHIREIEYADRELEAATENQDEARQNRLWERYGAELGMRGRVRNTQADLRRLRRQRRAAETNEELSDIERKERIEDIEEQMDRLMNDFNSEYNREKYPASREVSLFEAAGARLDRAPEFLREQHLPASAMLVASLPRRASAKLADTMG
jgi:hypothetical protein